MSTIQCVYCGKGFEAEQSSAAGVEVTCPHCGRTFNSAKAETAGYNSGGSGLVMEPLLTENEPVLAAGALLGQYEIKEMIGRGGMGTVYKAYQSLLDRYVAIKVLPAKLSDDQEFLKRFYREAKTLAGLSHPNIVAIYDMGREKGHIYFVMELVEGVTLRNMIELRKLRPEEALKVVPQLCDALEYAHTKGVVHRDIKPENIMLDKNGQVKIADFGLARIVRGDTLVESITRSNEVMGTYDYMAPEQRIKSKDVDHRVDIYSIGVVFYEMLTGELPIGKFELPSRKVQIDVRVDDIVMKSLENEPEKRFQRASEVGSAVTEILARSSSAAAQQTEKAVIPMSKELKTALASIASLVLGVIPSGVGNIIAVFLGLFARSEVRKGRGSEWASGLANIGIITSIVWLTIEFIGMSQGHFYGFLGTLLIGGAIYSGIALAGIYILGIVFGESKKAPQIILLIIFGICATILLLGSLVFLVFKPSSGFTIKSLFGKPADVQDDKEKQDEYASMEQLKRDLALKEKELAERKAKDEQAAMDREKQLELDRHKKLSANQLAVCDILKKIGLLGNIYYQAVGYGENDGSLDYDVSVADLCNWKGSEAVLGKDTAMIASADYGTLKNKAVACKGHFLRRIPTDNYLVFAAYPETKDERTFVVTTGPENNITIYAKSFGPDGYPDQWNFNQPSRDGWQVIEETADAGQQTFINTCVKIREYRFTPVTEQDKKTLEALNTVKISMDFEEASMNNVIEFINAFFTTTDPATGKQTRTICVLNQRGSVANIPLKINNSTLKETLDMMAYLYESSYMIKQGMVVFTSRNALDLLISDFNPPDTESENNKAINNLLKNTKIALDFSESMPFKNFVDFLSQDAGVSIVFNTLKMQTNHISPENIDVPGFTMQASIEDVLKFITDFTGLAYEVRYGMVVITTR